VQDLAFLACNSPVRGVFLRRSTIVENVSTKIFAASSPAGVSFAIP
jgi:hypothetical protein